MRRTLAAFGTVALLALSVVAASAQGGGGGRRGGMGGMGGLGLLRNPKVQQDLHMSAAQIEKVETEQPAVQQKTQELMQNAGGFQALRSMAPADREKFMAQMQGIQHQAVANILDNNQIHRFDQIELQAMGSRAFQRKDVQDKLHLTESQLAALDQIQQQANEQRRSMMQGQNFQSMSPEDRQKLGAQMQELQKSSEQKAMGVLSQGQLHIWHDMTGPTVDLGPMGGFGGFGRGRRGGGGGGAAGGGAAGA